MIARSVFRRRRMYGPTSRRRGREGVLLPRLQALDEGLEHLARSEQSGIEEIEQRPQIAQAILHRRAGQSDTGNGGELPDRSALPRPRITDGLRLIQIDEPPGHLRQPSLPHQHGVRRDDQIGIRQMRLGRSRDVRQTLRIRLGRVQEAQLQRRRKACRLVTPVSQQRRRNHENGRRSRPLRAVATLAQHGA